MKRLLSFVFAILSVLRVFSQSSDTRVYELRIYYTEQGRMDALVKRFTDHTTKLFEKHGMKNEGYWLAANDPNKLIYVLSYPSQEAREVSWKAFGSDPAWQKAREASEKDGKIVAKVESLFMSKTDFSKKIKTRSKKKAQKHPLVFEMRTYYCLPNRLPSLLTRFRNHTTKLFERHGMINVVYWTTIEKNGQQAKLVYILAHKSENAAKASFDAFVKDPEWIRVSTASEKDGKIIEKIESVFMVPLAFSQIR